MDAGILVQGLRGSLHEEARAFSDRGSGASDPVFVFAMGRMSRTAVVVLVGTLFLVAFVGQLEAGRFSEEDLEDLDLTPEERAVLTQEQVGDSEDYNPLKLTGRLAGEDDVEIVEQPEDLEDLVSSNKYVLLEFFAPWCGHCSALQPEFAKAATALKDEGVVLAKIDAVEHTEFASEYGVEAYPTLYFLVDGEKQPYTGGRTRFEFFSYVLFRCC